MSDNYFTGPKVTFKTANKDMCFGDVTKTSHEEGEFISGVAYVRASNNPILVGMATPAYRQRQIFRQAAG